MKVFVKQQNFVYNLDILNLIFIIKKVHIMSYDDMEMRWGAAVALYIVGEIEKAASLRPQQEISNPEIRLAHALRIQDDLLSQAA
jgi:hypothetical protein